MSTTKTGKPAIYHRDLAFAYPELPDIRTAIEKVEM